MASQNKSAKTYGNLQAGQIADPTLMRQYLIDSAGLVQVSETDTHVKRLDDALVAGTGIVKTKLGSGADETLQLAVNWASPSAIGGTTPAKGTFTNVDIDMIGAAASTNLSFEKAGVYRNILQSTGTESGSNTGSDLLFLMRADDGTSLHTALKMTRATGVLTALPTYSNAITTSVRDLQIDSSGNLGYVVSARKHKHKIKPVKETNRFIDKLRELNPVRYRYKVDGDGDGVVDDLLIHYGFVAEEVEEVFPELCSYDIVPDEGAKIIRDERGKLDPSVPTHKELATLNYSEMHAIAIAGLQHALDKIDELEAKVKDLERRLVRLEVKA